MAHTRERFMAKVALPEDDPGGCWVWTGAQDGRGYGKVWDGARSARAARLAVQLDGRDTPDGMQVDHLCRNRLCVNPAHLEVVTARENNLRSQSLSARRARQTHCLRGHEFTEENTRRDRLGRRVCRECRRIRSKRRAPHYMAEPRPCRRCRQLFIPRGRGRPPICCPVCRSENALSGHVDGPEPEWAVEYRERVRGRAGEALADDAHPLHIGAIK